MVGHDSGDFGMDLYGTHESRVVVEGLASAITAYGGGLNSKVNLGRYAFSDHWPFEDHGIPACVIIESCYKCNCYYHRPGDAIDVEPGYISYEMVEQLIRSVTAYMVTAAGVEVGDKIETNHAVVD